MQVDIVRSNAGATVPTPVVVSVRFDSLGLASPLLNAVKDEGYEIPTPIQAKAIPAIISGQDVLGCAQTGTGKTAAFALPILHRLSTMPVDKSSRGPVLPRVLVLSPTRELASQIDDSFQTYGKHTTLQTTCIFGGVSQFHQVRALHKGIDILVATPGRLMDLMQQGYVNLKNVSIFVLDEADRMLDMGFIVPIRRIAAALPKPRQTLLFSATMPKEIMHLAESLLHNAIKISVAPTAATIPQIEQSVYMIHREKKQDLLRQMLRDAVVERAIVFTRTKHGADKVAKRLNQTGVPAVAIHGNRSQNQRNRAMDGFKGGHTRVLVATDVAARGIDVDNITHVFNFDLPNEPESYVHRIGRTGRAGATGKAISFCDTGGEERGFLKAIERINGKKIPVAVTPAIEGMSYEETPGQRTASSHREPAHDRAPHSTRGNDFSSSPSRGGRGPARRSPSPAHENEAQPRSSVRPGPNTHVDKSAAHSHREQRPVRFEQGTNGSINSTYGPRPTQSSQPPQGRSATRGAKPGTGSKFYGKRQSKPAR